MQQELEQWCSRPKRLERLIVVLTGGTLATSSTAIDWERTDVLPEHLRAHLSSVLFYVDLSWAQNEARQTLLDSDFKKAVNLLVAALRGIDPIELSGQEVLQHRRNLRLRNVFVGAIALLGLVVFGLGVLAVSQTRSASEQVSLVLTDYARRAIEAGYPERAARLAALAAREGLLDVADPAAAPTLAAAAHRSSLIMEFRGHQGRMNGLEISRSGTLLLTWSVDGTVRVFNTATGGELAISKHDGGVKGAMFNPAGKRVLSWGKDGIARVWNAATGTEIAVSRHDSLVNGALFGSKGKRVLSWSDGGTARVWDAVTGAETAVANSTLSTGS